MSRRLRLLVPSLSAALAVACGEAPPPPPPPPPPAPPPPVAKAVFDRTGLDFGTAPCGETPAALTVTVKNEGEAALTVAPSLAEGLRFSVEPSSLQVEPGQSGTITVQPKVLEGELAAGIGLFDLLTLETNDPDLATEILAVKLTPAGFVLRSDLVTAAFGRVALGADAMPVPITLQNAGNAPVSVALAEASNAAFGLGWEGAPAPLAIAPGASATVQATFHPAALGAATGLFELQASGASCGAPTTLSLPVSGEGAGAVPFITSALDFGSIACGGGAPAAQRITLANGGNAPYAFTIAGASIGSRYTVEPAQGTVAAGSVVEVLVGAAAVETGTPGDFLDALTVTTDVPGDAPHTVTLQQKLVGAVLGVGLQTGAIAFGGVPVGTTQRTEVKITNAGNLPTFVTPSVDESVFTVTPATRTLIAPGASLTATVAFKPTLGADAHGTLLFATEPGVCGGAGLQVALSGTGTTGALAVSGDLDFGSTACGTTAQPKTETLSNGGNQAFRFTAELARGDSSPFSLDVTSGSLQPNGTAQIVVTPKAVPQVSQVPGDYGDTLTVTTDIPGSSPRSLRLTQSAKGAVLSFQPESLDFQPPVNQAQTKGFVLANAGNAPATVTFSRGGDGAAPNARFQHVPTNATSIAPGGSTSGFVSFTTPDITPQQDTLRVATTDTVCQPLPTMALTGTGQTGAIYVSTTDLSFGTNGLVACGSGAPAAQSFTIQNRGNQPFNWSAALGDSDSQFSLSMNGQPLPAGPQKIDGGRTVTITVTSKAIPIPADLKADAYADAVTITTDLAGDVPHVVRLHESAQGAVLAWASGTPSTLNFGNVPVETTTQQTLTLANVGNAASPTVSFVQTGVRFGVSGGAASSILAGGTKKATVTFSPNVTGTYSGQVVATSDASKLCAPLPTSVRLFGTGTAGKVSFSPASLDFGATNCGSTAAPQSIVFSNTGTASYTISPTFLKGSASPYTVTMNPSSGVVLAGGALSLTVTPKQVAAPTPVPGDWGDTLRVTSNAPGDAPHDIPLQQDASGAVLEWSEADFDFGTVPVSGPSWTRSRLLFNRGDQPATVSAAARPLGSGSNLADSPSITVSAHASALQQVRYTARVAVPSASTTLAQTWSGVVCSAKAPDPVVTAQVAPSFTHPRGQEVLLSRVCGSSQQQIGVTVDCGGAACPAPSFTVSLAKGSASPFTVNSGGPYPMPGSIPVVIKPVSASTAPLGPGALSDTLLITVPGFTTFRPVRVPLVMTAIGAVLRWQPAALTLDRGALKQVGGAIVNDGSGTNVPVRLQVASGPFSLLFNGGAVTAFSGVVGQLGALLEFTAVDDAAAPATGALSISLTPSMPLCRPLPANLVLTGQ